MKYAIELDNVLRRFHYDSYNPKTYSKKTKEKINIIYELLDKVKPISDDDFKVIYFGLDKGSFELYIEYEDIEEIKLEKLKEYYEEDYKEIKCWYKLSTSKYKNYRMISIDSSNIIYADMNDTANYDDCYLDELLNLVIYKIKESITMLDTNVYNEYINKNFSNLKRFGVIKRSDYWNLFPEVKNNLINDVSQEIMNYYIENASDKMDNRIKNMTSGKYFECVKMVYEINNYEINNLKPKELYLKYADGRDEGLSEIDIDSCYEFDKWYHDRKCYGGHPYEIIRGHSFARINLCIQHDEFGYYLSLDGRIVLRKEEIAKIFWILTKNNIPLKIDNFDIIKDSFLGNDYIGIVPQYVFPVKCEGYFTKYSPHEFTHLDDKMLKYIKWEPLVSVELR